MESRSPEAAVSPGVQERIQKTVLESLAPVRPVPGPGGFAWAFLGVFAAVLLLGAGATGVRSARVMTGWQFVGASLVLVAVAAAVALALGSLAIPGSRRRFPPAALLPGAAATLSAATAVLFPWRLGDRFWLGGLACLVYGLAWALPAGALLWLLLRRVLLVDRAITVAAAGLLAGLAGMGVVHLGCTNVAALHVALWHVAVPATSAAAGFILGLWQQRRA
jgi:hypothetical protein